MTFLKYRSIVGFKLIYQTVGDNLNVLEMYDI